jgi:hypothetical protein
MKPLQLSAIDRLDLRPATIQARKERRARQEEKSLLFAQRYGRSAQAWHRYFHLGDLVLPAYSLKDTELCAKMLSMSSKQTYPGGFAEGDLVVGPFTLPTGSSSLPTFAREGKYPETWDDYKPGFGIVDSSCLKPRFGDSAKPVVPIRVVLGLRSSGNYYPEYLVKVERPFEAQQAEQRDHETAIQKVADARILLQQAETELRRIERSR